MPGRILCVRLKNEVVDITIIAAYAPGDHLTRELRGKFWKNLQKEIGDVPRRSCKILGIDANGHIGRDGMGGVGEKGAERWTNNGHELEKTINTPQMVLLNTQSNCKNPGWTWQKRDGTGKGRIDYIAVDKILMSRIKHNKGACDYPNWGTQGSEIDHRPVHAILGIITLQERGIKQKNDTQSKQVKYSARNELLTRAYKTYIIMTDNLDREKQLEIDKEDALLVTTIQEKIYETINKNWRKEMNVNEMQLAIDTALKNTYDEILRTRKKEKKDKKTRFPQGKYMGCITKKKRKLGKGEEMVDPKANSGLGTKN
jgi:hypothetical protein